MKEQTISCFLCDHCEDVFLPGKGGADKESSDEIALDANYDLARISKYQLDCQQCLAEAPRKSQVSICYQNSYHKILSLKTCLAQGEDWLLLLTSWQGGAMVLTPV